MQSFDVFVQRAGDGFVTSVYQGHCAASSENAQDAAEKLGLQLFGESFLRAESLPIKNPALHTWWRLFASTEG